MKRWSGTAPAAVLLAAVVGSCTEVSTSPTQAVALEFDTLAFPALVTGDTLRDSLGLVAPLHALALNSAQAVIPGAAIQYITLDTGLTISATGVVTAQRRNGPVRVVASVSGIQSVPRTIEVARRPDTVVATGARDTTLLFTIPDSAAKNVTDVLGVKVLTADSADGITGTKGWLVSYQTFYRGAALARADTTLASLWDAGGRASTVDTTKTGGTSGRRLRVRSLLLSTQPDSFVVLATVRYRGASLRGSPVRFVIRVRPR